MSDELPTSRSRDSLPPAIPNGIWYRPDRPKIVGLTAWMCAAFGYIGFVLKGSQLPAHFMDMKWLNPSYIPMPYNRVQFSIAVTLLLAEMVVALFCIAGALGALKMRHWGRRTLVWYGILATVLTAIKAGWQVHMFDFMLDYQIATATQPVAREAIENPAFFALVVATIAQFIWPLITLSVMTRRYVIDAFDASEGGNRDFPPSDWESAKQ